MLPASPEHDRLSESWWAVAVVGPLMAPRTVTPVGGRISRLGPIQKLHFLLTLLPPSGES
jgi:hypothetical protein